MTIDYKVYDTATLMGVMRDLQEPSNYWLTLCFGEQINFTDEYVDFSKITDNRKLAPLVVPTAQGVPMYSAAEKAFRVKPAYLKPKDPVTASRMLKRAAGLGEINIGAALSPQQRYDAIVADIMKTHRDGIERRWEWMASKAIIDAEVTLEDERYPRTVVDFQRNADNEATLTGGNRWGQAGVSIISDVEGWRTTVRNAKFGGPTNRLTIGTNVWEIMRQDDEIRDMMRNDAFRNASNGGLDLNIGLREGAYVERVGRLSGTLEVVVYSDYYQDPDGTIVPMLDPDEIVLTGPNVRGVRCFGAIQDKAAGWAAVPIFPKMWDENDPSATLIMNQSAPLMVPVNPNATFHAVVL